MPEIYSLVECLVTYIDGSTEIRRPTFSQITIGVAMVNKTSVIEYLKERLDNVEGIEVIDVYYFRNEKDYLEYIKNN